MPVPNIFANVTTAIPLSQLDNNFATPITIGNTAVQLGNTVTTLNNMTLANVTINSVASTFPNSYLANSSVTIGNTSVSLGSTASSVGNLTLTNVTISSGNSTVSSESISGNLTFTGTGSRILGDFTNATITNRTSFQTSTANSSTGIYALPSGTSTAASWQATNAADPTNASKILIATNGSTDVQLVSGRNGTGTYLPLTFYTNGSEQMRLDTSGNLGIGTSSPLNKLSLPNSSYIGWRNSTNTAETTGITVNSSNNLVLYNSGDRVTVDSSGNVGIGTSSPSSFGAQLAVVNSQNADTTIAVNNTNAGTAASARFDLQSNAANYLTLQSYGQNATGTIAGITKAKLNSVFENSLAANSNGLAIGTISANPLYFVANNAERARIDSSGNLLVGTTSTPPAGVKVDVAGGYLRADGVSTKADVSVGVLIGRYTAAYGGSLINFTSSPTFASFQFDNSEQMRLTSGGNLTINGATATKASGTAWANPSDSRLKNNVRDYDKGLSELMQVRVREWEYNGKGGTTDGMRGLGVVADEVMTVLPNTVDEYQAKLNEGDEQETAIKRFDATEITWLLVKSLQEQQAMIEELKAKVAKLEGK